MKDNSLGHFTKYLIDFLLKNSAESFKFFFSDQIVVYKVECKRQKGRNKLKLEGTSINSFHKFKSRIKPG